MIKAFAMFVAGVMVISAEAITWQNRNGRSNRNSGNKTVHVSAKVGENTTPAQRLGFKIESTPDATNMAHKVVGNNAQKPKTKMKTSGTLGVKDENDIKTFKTSTKKK